MSHHYEDNFEMYINYKLNACWELQTEIILKVHWQFLFQQSMLPIRRIKVQTTGKHLNSHFRGIIQIYGNWYFCFD